MTDTLYIIDGHSQIYRAYYAPGPTLTSPTGEPTGAVHVFCQMLFKIIADRKPTYLAMAVDGPAERLLRRGVYADYKITRKPAPEDFRPQAQRIIEIVRAMGIPVLEAVGHEADDIMATAATRYAGDDLQVVLVSRDKDLDQLVGPNVILYEPMKGETLDAPAILATKGYPPDKAVEVQALAGDVSDNIPGVPGIGLKTAAKLIAQYGSADEVLNHADEQTPALRQRLIDGRAAVALSRQLVELHRNVPLDLDLAKMKFTGIDAAVRPIFLELGLNRLIDRLNEFKVEGPQRLDVQEVAARHDQTTAANFTYECIDTPEKLSALAAELAAVSRLAVDTETTGLVPTRSDLVGISLAWKSGHGVYLPIKGPLGGRTLEIDAVRAAIGPVLGDAKVDKVGQNIKFDMLVLDRYGFQIAGRIFDTMVAAWVLNPTADTFKLDALAAEMLNHRCIPIEEVIGRGRLQTTMDAMPIDMVTIYAAEDADVTLRLADVLAERLKKSGMEELFYDIEMPLLPVLFEMERTGIRVEPGVLKQMEMRLSKEADALREQIIAKAGIPFNPDSPKQLADVLFDRLKMPILRKVKTGPSTDSAVLEELAVLHEVPALILEYRRLTKLLSTYLTALAECIHPASGRVHTSFSQTGTVTGRLSSRDPNLQNIPIRSEQGRQIRGAFMADEGNVLLSADYSQVELRVLAHLCEDPTMIAAFNAGADIHTIVAAEVFAVPLEQVTPQQRSRAKTVNFGIIYGQTAFGLAVTLRIPRDEAGDFIKRYRSRFPRIDQFLAACVQAAKDNGYVETIFGRRRAILDIDSRNPQRRALAERLAINSVVQGSAADLIKRAMVNIHARIRNENRPSKMLLQIHDELLFEMPAEAVESEKLMIVREMEGAVALRVPVRVDVGVGRNWMEAK
ncbi:MAG: DNA polymerase I [Planctomycetaceae bacterium]|nr:DNA polymerase I [Planctomycetaceae bacterium]